MNILLCLLCLSAVEAAPFITKWNTSHTNDELIDDGHYCIRYDISPSNEIVLGLVWGGVYDFTIDWGDGTTEHITEWDQGSHVYAEEGVYEVTMEGVFEAWGPDGEHHWDAIKLDEISQWGTFKMSENGGWFQSCANLEVTATDAPDLTAVTDYRYAFMCSGITNPDFTAWDVSRATNFMSMFDACYNFDGDISTWDTSSVTSFHHMFYRDYALNSDLSNWDVSSVTSLDYTFDNCQLFNSDISGWDVSNMETLQRTFGWGHSFTQDLGSWDVSSVTNLYGSFQYALVFDRDLSSWDVSNVVKMEYTFGWASSYSQDLSAWDTSATTNMQYMLTGADSFDHDISNWDTGSVTDMTGMFQWNDAFDQDLREWNTTSLEQCDSFWNPGCNPAGVVVLGCVDHCCPDQVKHSNYALQDSLVGSLNEVVDVVCDEGYVGGGDALCSNITGHFTYIPCEGKSVIIICILILSKSILNM